MLRAVLVAAVLLPLHTTCAQSDARTLGEPPPPAREFRAAWVATVANIDWPSRAGLAVPEQQAELDRILDRADALNLNAIVFQVRPACDAMYRSRLEPWSEFLTGEQGRAPKPEWDPLAYAVRGAHARGLELHAWFNPYRARHQKESSRAARNHVSVRHPSWVQTYGGHGWLDPGRPDVRRHSLEVIYDVVERYDIDGVHLDDYFYPYPVANQTFDDKRTWKRYGRGLGREDWRRANVDRFVSELAKGVRERKPHVRVGISPFGIYRPGVPNGIRAGIDQYRDLAADPVLWMRKGWLDYLAPQLYWPIAQKAQSYPVLLDWWAEHNPLGRHIWIGNYTTRARDKWAKDELARQVRLTREQRGATGNIHFSMKALMGTFGDRLRDDVYRRPALVPASTWLDDVPPPAPTLAAAERRENADVQRWSGRDDVFLWTVYLRCRGRWTLDQVLPARQKGILVTDAERRRLEITAIAVAAVDRCGNESPRTVRRL